MKQLYLQRSGFLLLIGLLVLAIIIMLPSCSRKMTFQTSRVVPAATGSVKIKNTWLIKKAV